MKSLTAEKLSADNNPAGKKFENATRKSMQNPPEFDRILGEFRADFHLDSTYTIIFIEQIKYFKFKLNTVKNNTRNVYTNVQTLV